MSDGQLVLSLFPGIGLLDRAFEEAGFCVVRGPDVIWGGDIRNFDPPDDVFDGVIGGPPFQCFSALSRLNKSQGYEPSFGNLIPQFERVVRACQPYWFVMENVPAAPTPKSENHEVTSVLIKDSDFGGETMRCRRISFGGPGGPHKMRFALPQVIRLGSAPARAVTCDQRIASSGERIRSKNKGGGVFPKTGKCLPVEEMARLQGLPPDFFKHSPFTKQAQKKMIGNGVPMAMGRAVAKAVGRAIREWDQHLEEWNQGTEAV